MHSSATSSGTGTECKKVFLHKLVAQGSKLFWQFDTHLRSERHNSYVIFSPEGPVHFGRAGHLSTKHSDVFLSLLTKSGLNYVCRVDRGLQVFLHLIYFPTKTYCYLHMNNVLKSYKKSKGNFYFAEKVNRSVSYMNCSRNNF